MKHCPKCKQTKPLAEFYKKGKSVRSYCIECGKKDRDLWRLNNKEYENQRNSEYNQRNALKIRGCKLKKYWPDATWQECLQKYNNLLQNQNYTCGICNEQEKRIDLKTKTYWSLAVDHDHKTGEVRGLLCNKCNRCLGYLKDSIELLQKAQEYLKKTKA